MVLLHNARRSKQRSRGRENPNGAGLDTASCALDILNVVLYSAVAIAQ